MDGRHSATAGATEPGLQADSSAVKASDLHRSTSGIRLKAFEGNIGCELALGCGGTRYPVASVRDRSQPAGTAAGQPVQGGGGGVVGGQVDEEVLVVIGGQVQPFVGQS
jgi:hypothetical protein